MTRQLVKMSSSAADSTGPSRGSIVPALLLVLGLAVLGSDSRADADKEALSELRVFNRVVLLVKEQYVEPGRIRPKEMLRAVLDAVE